MRSILLESIEREYKAQKDFWCFVKSLTIFIIFFKLIKILFKKLNKKE